MRAARSTWRRTGSMPGSPRWPRSGWRDAHRAAGRPARRRLRLGREPEAGGAAHAGRAAARRAGAARSPARRPRLHPRAVAGPGGDGGAVAQRSPESRWRGRTGRWPSTCRRARVRLAQWLLDGVRPGSRWARCSATASSGGCTSCAPTSSSTSSARIAPRRTAADTDGTPPVGAPSAVVDGLELHRRCEPDQGDSACCACGSHRPVHAEYARCQGAGDARRRDRRGGRRGERRERAPAAARQPGAQRGLARRDRQRRRRRRPSWTSCAHRAAACPDTSGGAAALGQAAAARPAGHRRRSRRAPRPSRCSNAWAARLLGPAAGVRCRVEELEAGGDARARRTRCSWRSWSCRRSTWCTREGGRGAGDASEIELRVLDALRRQPPPRRGRCAARGGARAAGAPPGERSLADVIELAAARAHGARQRSAPLDGADLQAPHARSAARARPRRARGSCRRAPNEPGRGHEGAARALRALGRCRTTAVPAGRAAATGRVRHRGAVPVAARRTAVEARARCSAQAGTAAARRRGGWPSSQRAAGARRRRRPRRAARCARGSGSPRCSARTSSRLPVFRVRRAAADCASLADRDGAARRRSARGGHLVRAHGARAGAAREAEPCAARRRGAAHRARSLRPAVAQLPHRAGERWVGGVSERGDAAARRPPVAGAADGDQARPGAAARRACLSTSGSRSCRARSETTGDRVPVRPARRLRAAGDPARGAAGGRGSRGRSARLNRVLLETLELARLRAVDPAGARRDRALPAGAVLRLQRATATPCRPTSTPLRLR